MREKLEVTPHGLLETLKLKNSRGIEKGFFQVHFCNLGFVICNFRASPLIFCAGLPGLG